jgi:predicted 2-oxoglutarate/Fe(II)-dependent dioxygenase YbiX
MKKNLDFYVKKIPNFLDKKFCDDVIDKIQYLNWQQHMFDSYDAKINQFTKIKLSGEQELETASVNSEFTEIIMKKLWFEIDNYQKYYNFKWFNGWQGYSNIGFNKYEKNKKMAEHCDNISFIFDGNRKGVPILSLVGILNDNYKGGEFIMFQNKVIKLKQGDLLIFPSNFLFPHKVEPVLEGIRYSYVSWVY